MDTHLHIIHFCGPIKSCISSSSSSSLQFFGIMSKNENRARAMIMSGFGAIFSLGGAYLKDMDQVKSLYPKPNSHSRWASSHHRSFFFVCETVKSLCQGVRPGVSCICNTFFPLDFRKRVLSRLRATCLCIARSCSHRDEQHHALLHACTRYARVMNKLLPVVGVHWISIRWWDSCCPSCQIRR